MKSDTSKAPKQAESSAKSCSHFSDITCPLGMWGQGLRNFCLYWTLLPPGASVFHKDILFSMYINQAFYNNVKVNDQSKTCILKIAKVDFFATLDHLFSTNMSLKTFLQILPMSSVQCQPTLSHLTQEQIGDEGNVATKVSWKCDSPDLVKYYNIYTDNGQTFIGHSANSIFYTPKAAGTPTIQPVLSSGLLGQMLS